MCVLSYEAIGGELTLQQHHQVNECTSFSVPFKSYLGVCLAYASDVLSSNKTTMNTHRNASVRFYRQSTRILYY